MCWAQTLINHVSPRIISTLVVVIVAKEQCFLKVGESTQLFSKSMNSCNNSRTRRTFFLFKCIIPIQIPVAKSFILKSVWLTIYTHIYVWILYNIDISKGGNKRSFEIGYFVLRFASWEPESGLKWKMIFSIYTRRKEKLPWLYKWLNLSLECGKIM